MNTSLIISNYSSITAKEVVINDKVVLTNQGKDPRDLLSEIYTRFSIGYPKFFKMDNLSKLGFLTAELLLKDAALPDKYSNEETGIILMNSGSSIDTDRRHQSALNDRNNYFPSPSVFVYTLPNIIIGEICIRHKFRGENSFFIAENFDPEFLVKYINDLFASEVVRRCIGGWIDFEGTDFKSLLFLVGKPDRTESGFINFDPDSIRNLYQKLTL
jgi:hypothetical protein